MSNRDATRAAIQAVGGHLYHTDDKTDWFTLRDPDRFYGIRHSLAFQALLCGLGDGGLVVYYDKPNQPCVPSTEYAQFWIWKSDIESFIMLRMKEGDEIEFLEPRLATDEGWSESGAKYTHEGDRIVCEHYSDGCDCDGRLSRFSKRECPLDQLQVLEIESEDAVGLLLPDWQEVSASQRDYAAESAGY